MTQKLAITVVHESVSEPDRFLNPLRASGLNFQACLIHTAGELLHHLRDESSQLILLQNDGPVSLQQITQIKDSATQQHIPVIVLQQTYDRPGASDLISQGARDVLSVDETDLLITRIKQELAQQNHLSLIKRLEHKSRFCELRFERLLYKIREPVAYLHAGAIVFHNPAFTQLFEAKNKLSDTPILDAISSEDHQRFKDALRECILNSSKRESDAVKVRLQSNYASDKQTIELVLQAVDQQADPLIQITGLPHLKQTINSRDTLQSNNHERLRQAIETRLASKQAGSLIFLQPTDLETHKQAIGFTTLEKLLNHAANRLLKQSRHEDDVYRLSGSLFAIISNQKTANDIKLYADHLIQSLDGSYAVDSSEDDKPVKLRFTAGGTLLDASYGCNKLIMQADTALLIAKREKTGLHIFKTETDSAESDVTSTQWEQQTRALIENDQLKLAFQPITTLHAHPEHMYDVLLRTEDEHQLPLEYIQAIQASELEQALDHWVLEHSMNELTDHSDDETSPLTLFVRLSINTLASTNTAKALKQAFENNKLTPQQLVIKIRANDFVDQKETLKQALPIWAECGFGLTVEHVGRNTAEVSAFAGYPLNYISLDRHLISDLATNRHHQLIFQQLMAQCNELNLPIIAVGVQNADTLAMLWESGVNYIQGYYIQQPAYHLDFHSNSV